MTEKRFYTGEVRADTKYIRERKVEEGRCFLSTWFLVVKQFSFYYKFNFHQDSFLWGLSFI